MIGTCRLCGIEQELKRSHIIPEFLYKPAYDDKHRFIEVTATLFESPKYKQKGIREYLLCGNCETKLSKYEKHAKQILEGNSSLPIVNRFKTITGLNYTYFKLFQLSILWRCSISSLNEFSQVNLGKYQDEIRQMILFEEPGEPHEFGCIMVTPQSTDKLDRMIWTPVKSKIDGHTIYWFMFLGIFWMFVVSRNYSKRIPNNLYLSKSGVLNIGINQWQEDELLKHFMFGI